MISSKDGSSWIDGKAKMKHIAHILTSASVEVEIVVIATAAGVLAQETSLKRDKTNDRDRVRRG